MSIIIHDRDEKDQEKWIIRCAPQQMTDILVQVVRAEDNHAEFTFSIGELLREEIEDHGTMQGSLVASDQKIATLERWAALLECYASIIRTTIKYRHQAMERSS